MDAPTAPVTTPQADANAALIAALAGNNLNALRGTPAQQGTQPAATAPAPAPAGAPATVPAAPQAPAPPAPVETPQTPDEFIAAITGATPQQVAWPDEAKALFKQTYGEDDPLAFKEKVSQTFARQTLLEKELEGMRSLATNIKRIEEANPAFAAALLEEFSGRSGIDYLSQLPNPKILGKAGKDLGDELLMRTYMGDKFSQEEWEASKTGDFSALNTTKDVWEAKVKMLRPVAELLHDNRNKEHQGRVQASEQAIAQMREKDTASMSAAIAYASNDPFTRMHVNQQTIDALRNRSVFQGVFTNEDGTLHEQALSAAIKAQRYNGDVKRAYEAGLAAGKQSGLQEGTAQLPNARPGGRVVPIQQHQQEDPYRQTLASVLKAH